jgi:hypothetical protein
LDAGQTSPGQHIRHGPTGNGITEMPVPGDAGTKAGQDTGHKRTAVDESYHDGDGERNKSFLQKAGQDQESNQPEDQATRPDVDCRPSEEP